jgi:hypothetical protein
VPYKITGWKDHVVQRPKTYTIVDNPDGSKTLVDAPGETIQQGTPMSATNFNNAETGVANANFGFDALFSYVFLKIGHSGYSLEGLEVALKAYADAAKAEAKTYADQGKAEAKSYADGIVAPVSANVATLFREMVWLKTAVNLFISTTQMEQRKQDDRIVALEAYVTAHP